MVNNIKVYKMIDYDYDISLEVADVFVDGYYKDLSFFTKNKEKLKGAFKNSFNAEVFYIAEMDGKIVGILACSNNSSRAMHLIKKNMKKHLGFFMGSLAYFLMHKEFHTSLDFPNNVGFIECVATSKLARNKGVCTKLLEFVMQELPYDEYILDVADANENAYRLYKKMGFIEFKRKKENIQN